METEGKRGEGVDESCVERNTWMPVGIWSCGFCVKMFVYGDARVVCMRRECRKREIYRVEREGIRIRM